MFYKILDEDNNLIALGAWRKQVFETGTYVSFLAYSLENEQDLATLKAVVEQEIKGLETTFEVVVEPLNKGEFFYAGLAISKAIEPQEDGSVNLIVEKFPHSQNLMSAEISKTSDGVLVEQVFILKK